MLKKSLDGISYVSIRLCVLSPYQIHLLSMFHGGGAAYVLLRNKKTSMFPSTGLSPTEEVNRLELTVLHNYIYCDLLNSISQPGMQDLIPLYTQVAKVFYRGINFLFSWL